MNDPSRCPECDSLDTERVHVEWHMDMVETVRICGDCPVQYTVSYGDPIVVDRDHLGDK